MTDASSTTTTNNLLSLDTSNHVYIRSPEHAWIPCRLLEKDATANTATVSVPVYKDELTIQSDGGKQAKRHEKKVIELKEYINGAFPLQNVKENGVLREVPDMVDLPFLHEAAILYNLKSRHSRALPYTRTGDIIIACNPYKWYHDLYAENTRNQYAKALVYDPPEMDARTHLAPHVYETSSLAYRGLAVEGENQSILVSGESGAGKTETVKILLSDLASVQRHVGRSSSKTQKQSQDESPIVQRVLDSNPLLEAFGNAKTRRNDNSSRFGKYIQLQFDAEDAVSAAYAGKCVPSCVLAGSKCEVYLLEKSRVVSHEEEERTYHIFYQLLAADDDVKTRFWKGLENTDNESFSYVGFTETESIEGTSDADRFRQTCDSLALVGIKDDKLTSLMRAICIVLQLGNLVFESDEADHDRSVITSEDEFADLSELLGVPKDEMLPAFTVRTITARNEAFKVPLNAVQAKDSCDAFAKEIYAKTFLWLVRAINAATCAEHNYEGVGKKKEYGIIGMLDIFGFEVFETNRFEQLCINYANEKLQARFTQDIFRSVQAEYEYEGIELGEITYDDNTDVLDLVEGRMGLLAFLNEECVRPGGNDKSYVSKAKAMNKESPCFYTLAQFSEFEFGIIHYAGKVVYDSQNFVTKNMDTLPIDYMELAAKSTNDILKNELTNDSMMDTSPTKAAKTPRKAPAPKKSPANSKSVPQKKGSSMVQETVWTKFRNQLEDLMETLKKTRTRYIRCIKPNTLKEPLLMQHNSTVEQLRCAGVVAAVTISRSAFPNRLELIVVLDRFRALWPKGEHVHALNLTSSKDADDDESDPDVRNAKLVGHLLTKALKEIEIAREDGKVLKAFVIGRTRVYFRAGALEYLEAERVRALGIWAVEIQKISREFLCRRRYRKLRWLSIRVAAFERMRVKRVTFLRLRNSSIVVQCCVRIILAQRYRLDLDRNFKATLIQTRWRISRDRSVFGAKKGAAIVIQTMSRGSLQRPKYRQALQDKKDEAKLENQLAALQRKLEEAEQRHIESERLAEERARKAVEQYKEEKETSLSELGSVPATFEMVEDERDGESFQSAVESQQQHHLREQEQQQITEQQQRLMDESGKMLEYLRKEVFKLRSQNAQMRTDFDLLKENNQRLMDANASAGASFAALNQHAKQLAKTNEKLQTELGSCKGTLQKVSVTQVELKEELKMKQATYVAEVHSRLQYQKALASIVDLVQESCRDTRLVESILGIADSCEAEYMSGPTGMSPSRKLFSSPAGLKSSGNAAAESTGLMSSIRNLWA
ncbi:hypothetical protein MPSEU_000420200 [Mayamaea pseudoterrestris]|nr:hypothetical protein MPSEU_000420200 [Mayamaea pseudoterrestris]